MRNASSGRYSLHFSGFYNSVIAHAVFVFQSAFEDYRNNLHVVMKVHSKSLARFYNVIIKNSKKSKIHSSWIVIISKAEAVPAVKPSKFGRASFRRMLNFDFHILRTSKS